MGVSPGMTETFDSRSYEKDVPAGSSLPMVLSLHGAGGSGSAFKTSLGFSSTLTDTAIMIYPYAELEASVTTWNAGPDFNPSVDDLTWLQGLIAQVITDESVDTAKIYMLGHSNGGMMNYRFSSESIRDSYTNPIAKAITLNAAIVMTEAYSYTNQLYNISGVDDATVPPRGNATYKSDIFEYVQSSDVVNSRSEYRTIGGTGHTVASLKSGFAALGTTLEAEVIRFFEL